MKTRKVSLRPVVPKYYLDFTKTNGIGAKMNRMSRKKKKEKITSK